MSTSMKPSLVVFAVRERDKGKKAVWSRVRFFFTGWSCCR